MKPLLDVEECGLPDWPKIWSSCWRRLRRWRVPPRWSARDWQEEAKAQGQAAAIQAAQDFDPDAQVPLPVFVRWRVMAAVLAQYRREWAYGLRCREVDAQAAGDNGHWLRLASRAYDTVQGAMTSLTEADRSLIDRLFWQGGTQAEIALALGISQQAVSKRKKAIFLHLRHLLTDSGGEMQE
jgi:DNA-directed RNA polymerase specialized sigma24 family protein